MLPRQKNRGSVAALLVLSVWVLADRGAAQPINARFDAKAPFDLIVGEDAGLQALTLFDLNGDGTLDLVAVNQDDETVHVLLGNGDGSFDEADPLEEFFDTPVAVAVADVASPFASPSQGSKDGIPDVIVGGECCDLVVFLGLEGGGFAPPEQDFSEILDAGGIVGIALGDFDKNACIDIAVVDDLDEVHFLCNENGNYFNCATEFLETAGEIALDITAGDFNGDGNVDVAVLNQDTGDVSPMFGNGDGSFDDVRATVPARSQGEGTPTDFDAADVNGDGITDLVVVTNEQFNDITSVVLLGQRSATFRSSPFSAQFGASAVTLADFDASAGRAIDAIVAVPDGFPVLQIGNGDGTMQDGLVADGLARARGARALVSGEVGGDALVDFIALLADGEQVQVVLNLSAQPTPTVTASPPPTPTVTASPPPTPTPTATASTAPTNTRTAVVPTPTATSSSVEDDGCQTATPANGSAAWMLLVPAALLIRRRMRLRPA